MHCGYASTCIAFCLLQNLHCRFITGVHKLSCLNEGWQTGLHLLYYELLNMFQTLIRPSSGASEYLLFCVGWLEACWCYVAGLSVGDVVSGYHITNWQSRHITPARLKSAYTTHQYSLAPEDGRINVWNMLSNS